MENVGVVTELGQYGAIGVMLALILLCAGVMYLFWRFATNHIHHANIAFNENTKALQKLTDIIKFKLKQ